MAQAVKNAGKIRQAGEPRATVPAGSCRSVDVGAQRVVACRSAAHALQVRARGAAGRPQRGDDGVAGACAVAAQLGAEVDAGGQVDGGIDVVGAGISRGDGSLTVLQRQAGAARAVHGGVDIDIVLGDQGQGVGTPADTVVDIDVAGAAAAAAAALDRDVAAGQVVRERCTRHVTAAGGHGEVDRIDQPAAVGAAVGQGGDVRVARHRDVRGAGFNGAAIAAIGRAGVERSAHADAAVVHVAQQPDDTAHVLQRARLHDAAVVDHGGGQRIGRRGRLRREDHLATVRHDQLLVVHQRVEGALIDAVTEQRTVVQLHGDLVTRRQQHAALARRNAPGIGHLGCEQGDVAPGGGVQCALVDDAGAAARRTTELVVAGQEAAIAQTLCGRHQTGDVDLR